MTLRYEEGNLCWLQSVFWYFRRTQKSVLPTIMCRGIMTYTVSREVNDGIEHITYTPDAPKYKTPIVFQHGAWHGAWCWQWWQELFAEWGWTSHAHSLPNHGG